MQHAIPRPPNPTPELRLFFFRVSQNGHAVNSTKERTLEQHAIPRPPNLTPELQLFVNSDASTQKRTSEAWTQLVIAASFVTVPNPSAKENRKKGVTRM